MCVVRHFCHSWQFGWVRSVTAMTIALVILALLAVSAVVATIVQMARDGYGRVPTRADAPRVARASAPRASAAASRTSAPARSITPVACPAARVL